MTGLLRSDRFPSSASKETSSSPWCIVTAVRRRCCWHWAFCLFDWSILTFFFSFSFFLLNYSNTLAVELGLVLQTVFVNLWTKTSNPNNINSFVKKVTAYRAPRWKVGWSFVVHKTPLEPHGETALQHSAKQLNKGTVDVLKYKHNPCLQKLQNPKLIWKDVYT